MAETVRVRIAPSPTGALHIGNVRAGLFNWLFARHHRGVFILRIDDTDAERSRDEHVARILESFRWLGLDWDEGPEVGGPYAPYFQSQRLDRYRTAAEGLLAGGKAFRCYCSAEELEAKRQAAARRKEAPRYDGRCLELTDKERAAFEAEGRKPAIRFRLPDGPPVVVEDLVRGRIELPRAMLDHFIIVRSDAKPVYNFCTVLDEADHKITHVIRGDDHLSNTPKQLLLMEALGVAPHKYAHLPQILGLDRARLSKRHGAPGVLELRDEGFLREAVLNFLALLGWSYDAKTELFSLEELVEKFSLERVGSAPAVFDETKLVWMNGHYLRHAPSGAIEDALRERIAAAYGTLPAARDTAYVGKVVALVRDGLKTLAEVVPATEFFFKDDPVWEEEAKTKLAGWPKAKEILTAVKGILESADPLTPGALEAKFRAGAETQGLKFKDFVHPTRFATTGRTAGPSLFHLLEVLGRDRCLARIRSAAGGLR